MICFVLLKNTKIFIRRKFIKKLSKFHLRFNLRFLSFLFKSTKSNLSFIFINITCKNVSFNTRNQPSLDTLAYSCHIFINIHKICDLRLYSQFRMILSGQLNCTNVKMNALLKVETSRNPSLTHPS